MEILERRHAAKDRHPEYVFPLPGKADHPSLDERHTMRHCGQSWPAQLGERARLGGWSVRGLGAMDGCTHLYIEDLRPVAEKLAKQWKVAAAVRAAEKETEAVVRRPSASSTLEDTISQSRFRAMREHQVQA